MLLHKVFVKRKGREGDSSGVPVCSTYRVHHVFTVTALVGVFLCVGNKAVFW